jgi:Calx-beta domain/HYR domain
MSIKARRGFLLVALMVIVSVLVFLVGPLSNKALAQTEPPNLSGEQLVAHDNGDAPGPTVGSINIFDRACDPTGGTGTFRFTASGDAFGPYPGTFTETGTVEVGPPPNPFSGNAILSLTTNFEIDSPVGHVTSTKRFVPGSSTGSGVCYPMEPSSYFAAPENVQVEATIETPDGRTCTTGTADLSVSENFLPPFGFVKGFHEWFDAGFDTLTCGGSEETKPQISMGNATVDEGDTGTSDANFNVTLSEASTSAVTVDYATADGTATQAEDYQQTQGTLTFEANQTTKTVTVPVSGDTTDEPDERFSVLLSNARNAGIAEGEGSATIVDDDEIGDTTPPVLSLPNDMTVEATGPNGAEVTYNASANDGVDGTVDVNCAPASGSTFSLGDTTVNCSARDAAGNEATGSFKVSVGDTTAPSLTVPSNTIVVEATDASGAAVNFANDVSANDAVDPSPSINCTPASGTTFALGPTQISCTAKDAVGNESAAKTFDVKVQDTTAPSISGMPSDINETAPSSVGAVIDYTNPKASDLVDGNNVAVNCSPPSGSTFPLGKTTVTCSATDKAGNKAEESFKVSMTYAWSGLSQPINGGSTPEYSDDTSVFKLGSTVPVKFTLTNASAGIAGAEAKLYAAKVTNQVVGTEVETTSTAAAGSGNLFRYDATSDQYVFNWSTKGLTAGTYQLRVDLTDGASRTVRVSLR